RPPGRGRRARAGARLGARGAAEALPDAERARRAPRGGAVAAAGPRRADRAAAQPQRHARGARGGRRRRRRPPARPAQERRRLVPPGHPDRAPDPMSDELALHIRPELARPSPYRWQEGIPDGPVDRFDMNTGPDAPAWYAGELARLAAIPPNDYPDASYAPLKRAIAGFAGVDAEQ